MEKKYEMQQKALSMSWNIASISPQDYRDFFKNKNKHTFRIDLSETGGTHAATSREEPIQQEDPKPPSPAASARPVFKAENPILQSIVTEKQLTDSPAAAEHTRVPSPEQQLLSPIMKLNVYDNLNQCEIKDIDQSLIRSN